MPVLILDSYIPHLRSQRPHIIPIPLPQPRLKILIIIMMRNQVHMRSRPLVRPLQRAINQLHRTRHDDKKWIRSRRHIYRSSQMSHRPFRIVRRIKKNARLKPPPRLPPHRAQPHTILASINFLILQKIIKIIVNQIILQARLCQNGQRKRRRPHIVCIRIRIAICTYRNPLMALPRRNRSLTQPAHPAQPHNQHQPTHAATPSSKPSS